MPPLPAVPAVVQLAFGTTSVDSTHPIVNRLHIHYTGAAPTSSLLTAFATTVLTAWGSALGPSSTDDKSFTSLDVIDLSSPTAAQAVVVGAVAGTLAGEPPPLDTSLVMSAITGRRYRGGHPRTYLAVGASDTMTTARDWGSTFAGVVLTAWSGLLTAIEGAGWTGAGTLSPVNVSYYAGFTNVVPAGKRAYSVPTLRVGGPVVDPITSYVARTAIGSQRRRLRA